MRCQVTWGSFLQKSEVQIPDWELGQKDLYPKPRTQPGNTGLQEARVLPALSAFHWGVCGEAGWLFWLGG